MAEPYNYTITPANPNANGGGMASFMAGAENAAKLSEMRLNQEASRLKIEQLKTQQDQQRAMQADMSALSANPTPAAISSMMVKYPQLSEQLKRSYDTLSSEQQKSKISQASEIYSAMNTGDYELTKKLLSDQANAYKNSGNDKDAEGLNVLSKMIDINPEQAKVTTGLFLAASMGPDKFSETFSKLQADRRAEDLHPADMTKAQADAQKAAVAAKFAESDAVMDLQKKGWDITKIQEDIKIAKENNRIAAMNAAANREGNALKRQELQLKVQEAISARDEKVRGQIADVTTTRANMDNMLNTADRILQTPAGVIDSATGPISSRLPTTSQSTADFEALVENLSSQSFLSQVGALKGMGALSNAEGEKLQSALQNLSLKQSAGQLTKNVKEAQRIIFKARQNLSTLYGMPDTIPDTPDVKTQGGDVDSLLKKYGVQ
jgi:hypothetical protein